jgi:hypothetical protein
MIMPLISNCVKSKKTKVRFIDIVQNPTCDGLRQFICRKSLPISPQTGGRNRRTLDDITKDIVEHISRTVPTGTIIISNH